MGGVVAFRTLGCAFVVWDGDVKPEEWHAQYNRMFSDPAFPPGGLMLADLRTAGGAPSIDDVVIEDMDLRWNRQAERLADLRLAIVPNGAWNKARRRSHHARGSVNQCGHRGNELTEASSAVS